ncbi:MAG: cytochrome bc complex cytochrome b subunit, partial [Gammaproteobacteria bacterium]|nr:cytochrome bc complex cytochrome b subunit [Gammaproteobacteria bacterium]
MGDKGAEFVDWIDARFPMSKLLKEHATEYYAAKNFNVWYVFGVLAMVVLIIQLLTGIFLTMSYKPDAEKAFASVEYIMRDVEWGWLIRYMHSTGASAFFIVVYLHMFRGMMYGSYKKPRELLWIIGVLIYLMLMAEGFLGYLLPWGQMSYWGAQVIVSLFGAIPGIGEGLVEWIRGDYFISDITLNRFFALHVIAVPLALILLIVMHILALHETGSLNPDGIEIKEHKGPDGIPLDGVAFHPYLTAKDLVAIVIFLAAFSGVVFFAPEMGGYFLEHANFEPANQLKTPEHIAPVWYFTPFYAILRAIPDKLMGVIAMFASIGILFFLPWIDRGKVRSVRYRSGAFKLLLVMLVVSFIGLGYLGALPATETRTMFARLFSVGYFGFF